MKPINIVYVHSHDTGRHVQPYGYGCATPRLAAFAEEGVLFRQAFSAAPTCSPSRASLLTGSYPHANGMHGLDHRGGFVLNDYGRHIQSTLKQNGYLTVLGGLSHIGPSIDLLGYDRVLGNSRGSSARVADVVPRVEAFLDSKPTGPIFLDAGFYECHKTQAIFETGDEPMDPRYCAPPGCLPDTTETREEMAGFLATSRILDRGVGRILDALDRNGMRENSLVIVTTDHGLPMPGMKVNLSDGGTGVLLMMRGPNGFSGGRVTDELVSQIDLFPTICDYLEIDRPSWLQGCSFLPYVKGESAGIREEIFTELTYHLDYVPMRAIRTKRWKYVRCFDEHSPKDRSDPGPARDLWERHGWPERFGDAEQLYDTIADPQEANNLIEKSEYASLVSDLRHRLESWQRQTGDPILDGPIPPVTTQGLGYVPLVSGSVVGRINVEG
jgi:N-sulfoglucosamine sulfohydrolase